MFCSCGAGGQCYISNDGIDAFNGELTISQVEFETGAKVTCAKKLNIGRFDSNKWLVSTDVRI